MTSLVERLEPSDREEPRRYVSDILVVDDDPNNLMAMEAALGGLACHLVKVRSGRDALKALLERDYAAILLDVQMPTMDGFETARLIRSRERSRHVPIIFVTAYSQNDADMRRGYELGAVDYLFKPIVPEVLRAKVQVFIELGARTAEVAMQAEQLRAMERAESERRLEEERQKWEAETLRKQNQHLEELDRRKDEFIAILAHELRNPLAPLVNGLELMKLATLTDPLPIKAREVMSRQLSHLTRLVDDLLDVSRISQGKMELHREVVDLGAVLGQALEACKEKIEKGELLLELIEADAPVLLEGDPVRLTQVVSNLLHNASRYTDPGGKIVVQWGSNGQKATIRVRDTGRGIAPELQERIFDMFVQERDVGRGLGLGLTLVRQLVEMHGGKVAVHSAGRGAGAEFIVTLPLGSVAAEGATHHEGAEGPVSTVKARSLRIVVVEDDQDVRETLLWLLEQWGHAVTVAATGPDGVGLVVDTRPDIALLDIGLPGLDGYGVARAVRSQLGEGAPRLVAMSGYGQAADRERSKAAGFDAHLVKPAEPRELQRVLADFG